MRYFITNVLPHHLSGKYKVSYAGSNFSWALINSFAFDRTFSIAPANVTGELADVEMEQLVYSDWRKKNSILRKLAPFKENWMIFKMIEPRSSLWFYNISLLNVLLFYLCKMFKPSTKCNVIVLDVYLPKRKISFANFFLWTINKSDAVIKLSNSHRFTCKNSVCLPGVVPEIAPSYPLVNEIKRDFMLSGLLREDISQITLIIKVFSRLPDIDLHITGFTENDEAIKMTCNKYPNIHYHGELPFDEYINLLHETPFLLNTRDPKEEGNQCNFPSKVIEGILHNRIIVSTIQYEQLSGLRYFTISSEEDKMVKQISEIFNMASADILLYANQSDYAKAKFNPTCWRRIMINLESSK